MSDELRAHALLRRVGDFFPRLWLVALTVWTLLLITPGNWFGSVGAAKVGKVGAGKLLHVSAYAGLTAAIGWLPLSFSKRRLLVLAMILHGVMTEIIQTVIPYREGCLTDVGIDTVSVLLGFILSYRWWPDHPK